MGQKLTLTEDMQRVLHIVNETNENLFVTGKAGTGKTTLLQQVVKKCKKNIVVAAPTAIAAINAGGVTLHSLFRLPFGVITPDLVKTSKFYKFQRKVIANLQTLIIDEVSMVRADVIDALDAKLKIVKKNNEPFGGVQIIMFGDLSQLLPVTKKEEKEILDKYYPEYFFFNASVWKETGFHVINLSQIFRQSDQTFIDLLNNIRNYELTAEDMDILSELKNKNISESYTGEYIHLCTHKASVEKINATLLGEPTWSSEVVLSDDFPTNAIPCDQTLKLRVGARVMALCNNSTLGYYNGMLGEVVELGSNYVLVRTDEGKVINFTPHKWSHIQYIVDGDQIKQQEIGSCEQYPLTLAWAITIHKSQGLTFNKAILHISRTFCSGQLYVALSRCRTLEGVITDGYVTRRMLIPEPALIKFEKQYRANGNWYGKVNEIE